MEKFLLFLTLAGFLSGLLLVSISIHSNLSQKQHSHITLDFVQQDEFNSLEIKNNNSKYFLFDATGDTHPLGCGFDESIVHHKVILAACKLRILISTLIFLIKTNDSLHN